MAQEHEKIDPNPDADLKLVSLVPAERAAAPTLLHSEIEKAPTEASDPYVGSTIDQRYYVEAILGEGGMGVVYRCTHSVIGKKVAIKILRSDFAKDKEVTERFVIEAKAASAIGNEHIIDISDFGRLPDGSAYFVMEYLDGVPLSARSGEGKFVDGQTLAKIGIQIAEGLQAAHESGVVHRDLKPDNVFLTTRRSSPDFVKILDFGIAKVNTGTATKLTQAGSVFGTPHYMAPEQAAGAAVDHRGDIYSVGVMFYEMATGSLPFDADNFMAVLTQQMYKAPPRFAELNPDISYDAEIEAIVLKCLSKRPELRYQSMQELSKDLRLYLAGESPLAVSELLERNEGYDVPADYFEEKSRRGPLPSIAGHTAGIPTHGSSKKWLFAGVGGAGLAVISLLVIINSSSQNDNTTAVTSPEAIAPNAAPAEEVEVPAPPAPSAPVQAEIDGIDIVVGLEPRLAHAFRGDEDLGSSPLILTLKPNEKVKIKVRHAGYESKTIELDGTETKKNISLERLQKASGTSAKPPAAPAPTKPKTKVESRPSSGEIQNPWD